MGSSKEWIATVDSRGVPSVAGYEEKGGACQTGGLLRRRKKRTVVSRVMLNRNEIADNLKRVQITISPNEGLMSNDPQNESFNPEELAGQSIDDIANRMPKIIPFDQLARCGEEIWIECNGQIYRLRRTRQGKLILTK